jgi:sterol desaturase/sphingolipid hydroxylase (fatty acid hydroxylase superfamily)
MHYESQTAAAAAVLAGCWTLEALAPIARAHRVGATRCRHLLLGAINAALATIIAVSLACVDGDTPRGLFRALGSAAPLWVAGLAAFLILDLCQYAGHVLMHKVPVLWRLHTVHHHAEHVESTTAFRFHTLETLLQGMLLIPLVLVGVRVHDIAVYNAALLPMSLFHHANVRLPTALDKVLRAIVVTPSLHRLHHSRWQPQTDSNYSAVLSIWDRLFGTLKICERPERVSVGLDGFDAEHTTTVRGMLRTPFTPARSEPGAPPAETRSRTPL